MNTSIDPASQAGVIWISGYSAAGKTTVGRKVEAKLKDIGISTIFLDGDDLRSIFSARWGYEREDRIELARVYFRLCNHLASQGYSVVISAVAMFTEARNWLRQNVSGLTEVYLDVSEDERRRRDKKTKNIYEKIGHTNDLYDGPDENTLIIDNSDHSSPDKNAETIVGHYLSLRGGSADFGRTSHWNNFYSLSSPPLKPSPFAEYVAKNLDAGLRLLEIGCGNGRDSMFFSSQGQSVTAIDVAEAAIEKCVALSDGVNINYFNGVLPDLVDIINAPFDVAYCRFVIHAMPISEEIALIRSAFSVLRPGGRFFIECRSINDPMAREGEIISPTERIHGHYRRFIVRDELENRLRVNGFDLVESLESNGLAVYKDEDPVVIRIIAKKLHE